MTTTIHEPIHSHRGLWAALAIAVALALALAAASVVVDDGSASAPAKQITVERPAASQGAHVSADAAEAHALNAGTAVSVSADAAERRAADQDARDVRACTYSVTPPEALERCLNGN